MPADVNNEMKLVALAALERAEAPLAIDGGAADVLKLHLAAAATHADVDAIGAGGHLSLVKSALMRVCRLFLRQQAHFNRSTVAALQGVEQEMAALRSQNRSLQSQYGQLRRKCAADLASYYLRLDEVTTAVDSLAGSDEMISSLTAGHRELASEVRAVRFLFDGLVKDLRRTGSASSPETLAALAQEAGPNLDTLYGRFEDEFRGTVHEISGRLRPYLDEVSILRGSGPPVVDLGSGRGEWLRLLSDAGIPAIGIDINAAFVNEMKDAGLDARLGDALVGLGNLAPGSVGAVTAFQFVEHISVDQIDALLDLAATALAPGGLILLETPNPSNLRVGAAAFYRDPTHVRPVHPELLAFLVKERGFVGVETRFLHPSAEFEDKLDLDGSAPLSRHWIEDIRWALYGPQDYAVLGRKPATAGD